MFCLFCCEAEENFIYNIIFFLFVGRLNHEKDVIDADDGFATVEESEVGKNNKQKSLSSFVAISHQFNSFIL